MIPQETILLWCHEDALQRAMNHALDALWEIEEWMEQGK